LSKFLKISFAAPDPKARLQHRRKIMNPFFPFVKTRAVYFAEPRLSFNRRKHRLLQERGALYRLKTTRQLQSGKWAQFSQKLAK